MSSIVSITMEYFKRIVLIITLFTAVEGFGQNYSFKVKYGMIQAGTAELIYHLENGILNSRLNINSSRWLSTLWALSDSMKSMYAVETAQLKIHTKAIHEGSYHRNYQVEFFDSNRVQINGKSKDLITKGLKDIPSLLFELSKTHFNKGDTLHYRVWDGKGYGALVLLVEKVTGPTLLKPFSEAGWHLTPLNSTRKSRGNHIQLALLLSESLPHIPLRIEIDTKYGNVLMRLEKP